MAGYGGYVSAYGYGGSVVGMGPSMRRAVTDAVFGAGVYVTKLGPETARVDVAKNNYDGAREFYMSNLAKTHAVFEILLPTSKVRKTATGRDIYLHSGDIIIDPNTVQVYIRYD
ncbi:hypothetical protein MAR_034804 [Mya arenaria]|uniref:Uncharacterized protein n=1 Tax=Mya arenaria TaxID=6604 RepID=A0ABY7EM69_MYAAR|nr:hypothetical protein MAR_034804 [Mya arenaria]